MEMGMLFVVVLAIWFLNTKRYSGRVASNSDHLMYKYQLLQLERRYKSSQHNQNYIVNKL